MERKETIIELVQTEINYGNDFRIIKEVLHHFFHSKIFLTHNLSIRVFLKAVVFTIRPRFDKRKTYCVKQRLVVSAENTSLPKKPQKGSFPLIAKYQLASSKRAISSNRNAWQFMMQGLAASWFCDKWKIAIYLSKNRPVCVFLGIPLSHADWRNRLSWQFSQNIP